MLIFSLEVVNGSIMFENGDKYIGDFKNGELNGSGTYYYRNGDIYKGEWLIFDFMLSFTFFQAVEQETRLRYSNLHKRRS